MLVPFEGVAQKLVFRKSLSEVPQTVAFFYISSNGAVVVRNPADYIPAMIEWAGGRYALSHLAASDISGSSVTVSMEDFYTATRDADYLVYNAAIDAPIESMDELIAKNELLADFKAVKEGRVWCADRYLYQATDIVSRLILDFHHMLLEDGADMTFLRKIQ